MAATELRLKKIKADRADVIAVICITRPEAANSFSAEVMIELTAHLRQLATKKHLRAVVLMGKGKHFSAGADLKWMKDSANLSQDENISDSKNLTDLFEALYTLPVPTIAAVTGAAYGGAVGLTACCDFAVATKSAKFCLSEARLGLMPAVILPYLARKMAVGQLRRLALTARVFTGDDALAFGLVQRVCADNELNRAIVDELNQILTCSPDAQRELKNLLHQLMINANQQSESTALGIAALRTSTSAQAGLKAFFAKANSPWNLQIPAEWTIDD